MTYRQCSSLGQPAPSKGPWPAGSVICCPGALHGAHEFCAPESRRVGFPRSVQPSLINPRRYRGPPREPAGTAFQVAERRSTGPTHPICAWPARLTKPGDPSPAHRRSEKDEPRPISLRMRFRSCTCPQPAAFWAANLRHHKAPPIFRRTGRGARGGPGVEQSACRPDVGVRGAHLGVSSRCFPARPPNSCWQRRFKPSLF